MSYFSIIGAVYVFYLLYRFVSFIFLYFVGSYSLDEFSTGGSPYALVTGSADGIGKGVAKQLYKRGFNLILHGRDEKNLIKAADEIRAARGDQEGGEIRMFIADATKGDHDFRSLVAPFKDLNISILFNNVGGTAETAKIDEWPMEKIVDTINMNLLFSTGLIHALLPVLRNRRGKSLIVNVGSIAGTFGHPRLALYCACKSFSRMFANALDIDERQFTSTNVQYMYLNVGEVSTRSLRKPVTFVRPDPDTFGKAVVDRLGCGRREVTPYVLHAMHCWFLSAVGEYFAEQMVTAKMRKLVVEVAEWKKKQ